MYTPEVTAVWSGAETTWGTVATVDTKIGTIKNASPDIGWEVYEVQGAGDGREVQNFLKTNFKCRLNLNWEVHEFTFLRHFIGPLSGAGTTASKYTLTEANLTGVTANTHIIPATIEIAGDDATDDVDKYSGMLGDNFTLSCQLNAALTAQALLIGKTVTSSTTATSYTPLTSYPWMFSEGTLKYDATPTAITAMRSASITYSNNLRVFGDWATTFISMPIAGNRRIGFSCTAVMSSTLATQIRDTFYGQANTPLGTPDNIEFAADKELHLIFSQGSATGDRNAEIKLDQCIIDSIQKPVAYGSNDVVLLTWVGRAKTSHTNKFVEWWVST